MIPEDRLTAYALNELDGPERAEVEAQLDPESRRSVDAIRAMGAQLTAALSAEAKVEPVVPKSKPSRRPAFAALAASMLLAAGLGIFAYTQNQTSPLQVAKLEPEPSKRSRHQAKLATTPSGPSASTLVDQVDSFKEKTTGAASLEQRGMKPDLPKPAFDLASDPPGKIAIPAESSAQVEGDPSKLAKEAEAKSASPAGSAPKSDAKDFARAKRPEPNLPTAGTPAPPLPVMKPAVPTPQVTVTKAVPAPAAPAHSLNPSVRGAVAAGGKSGSSPADEKKSRADALGASPFGGYEANTGFTSGLGTADRFPAIEENAFVKVEGQAALSTFGVDVDTASYSIVRKMLSQNQMPPQGAVRLEEMVNYFPYRDAAPSGNDPFGVTVEVAECPWQPKHRLARIGLKAKPIAYDKRPASNLVFLIDVSGSMDAPNRLPLVKASLKLLINELSENDRVAMVVYAGASGMVLESTSAMNKPKILDALDRLQAGGSTNGASGIELAYQTAKEHFIENGTNRVILCTDGDWNVGTTSTEALVALIEEKRKSNVFLSVFGFGMGNLKDEMMVNLAGKGNGQYYYVDNIKEARKSFVEQMGGTLVTVAKDVKIQVEFNPAKVGSYRLLGYEKRKLAAEDFHNDAKDAGEMGAGHVVTALYELTPPGTDAAAKVDGLRYQKAEAPLAKQSDSKEAFVVKLRHKHPMGNVSTERELPVNDSNKPYGEASEDFRFAAAVASYAMLLRDSPHKGLSTYGLAAELANAAKTWDPGSYRAEFVKLVEKAKAISQKP